MMERLVWLLLFLSVIFSQAVNTVDVDPNGYVVYCPCMGRFGNQADHFLGSLSFAHGLNRTLVLPPWVEYRTGERNSVQVPFDTYFQVAPLQDYHRVMTMEKFMKELAPVIWPPGKRTAFCYMARPGSTSEGCNAKDGNPFGPFWNTFNVDFDSSEFYGPLYYDSHRTSTAKAWHKKYPVSRYPVLAFTGAPASFPVNKEDVYLHKYLKWSKGIQSKADEFIKKNIGTDSFLGIHLRNGVDWSNACNHASDSPRLFAAPQCLGYNNEYGKVTKELCFPSEKTIISQVKKVVKKHKLGAVFVATDNDPMVQKLKKSLEKLKVKTVVTTHPSDSPHMDLAILGKADFFIGNCVSTFSAFAKRERDAKGLPSAFWAFKEQKVQHEEL
ncbi:GDP-fucose protein O-fucosyltransferase 1 [Lingula anatina]|uniref:GDP-fucose protein O-fucosyltransferase 1 n=1 Tax=Lingula anatina TaxID=7574 RepID=A0A1S3IAM6_LINAN|nr:GDP-fucose protein O-fucosyltransferase 1 [Lingula anatina]XP_013394459.1 GDP-fucose protein O-fucosyltransferase 1 [Lingula anatina]|eukprot:XP_013394458.1 GDP-fucose protein O-fucosyltransferase 1 [Lingula anatina]